MGAVKTERGRCAQRDEGILSKGCVIWGGNVWEWVADQYHRTYEDAPGDGRAWCDVDDCGDLAVMRVFRGSDYRVDVTRMRASARGYYSPTVTFFWMGFRLASD